MKVYYFVILVCAFIAGSVTAANPHVTLHVTGTDANDLSFEGEIVLELYPDKAPITVDNFLNYVESGFYDGLIFHRVIEDFMIQGGGFNTEPSYMPTEPEIENECANGLSNLRGTIAMARQWHPHSATAQFFINHADNTNLDMDFFISGSHGYYWLGYCVFGKVVSGMEIVNAIAGTDTQDVTIDEIPFEGLPVKDVVIQKAELTKGIPACIEKLEGDIDGDCDVDLTDFAKLAANWLECNAINDCQ